jgi:hypothetical protein
MLWQADIMMVLELHILFAHETIAGIDKQPSLFGARRNSTLPNVCSQCGVK